MASRHHYEELTRQLSAVGAVKRELARVLPPTCPAGSASVLLTLGAHGEMRMGRLAELMAVDMSVTSRHVAHVAERGWIDRSPDPEDRRSRILRLTAAGERLLDAMATATAALLAERLSDWTDDEVDQLTRLMTRLRASFGDCRGPGTTTRPRTTQERPPTTRADEPALPPT